MGIASVMKHLTTTGGAQMMIKFVIEAPLDELDTRLFEQTCNG